MWERACSRRRQHIQHRCQQTHRYREQARSHRGSGDELRSCSRPQSNVGASLLAMAAAHPAPMPAGPPLSRAGSLPQGIRGRTQVM
ncbi:hypothetical protein FGE05_23125 [Pseudomonas sp. ICMP22404]|nr:hypothetical protein FGE05_23125 [Pseudomonas sp. ICMP22404]